MSENPAHDSSRSFVNYDDVPARQPPILASGPLAWVRKNLFNSLFDTILTLVSAVAIVAVVVGLLSWSIRSANWFVVTFNIRQFMVGRYEASAEWRVHLAAMFAIVAIGVALAAYSRLRARAFVGMILVAAFVLAMPPLTDAAIGLPPMYVTASNVAIASGSISVSAEDQLAFTAQEGETIRIALAEGMGASDANLAAESGFTSRATNTLRNAAIDRISSEKRQQEIENLLASNLITPNQRAELETELERLEIPPAIVETYAVNQVPVSVRLLDGATLDVLAEGTLSTESDAVTLTAPAGGWYVLEKTITDGEGAAILTAEGVAPLFQRSFTQAESVTAEGEVIAAGRVNQYIRMTDNFLVEAPIPVIDDVEVPYAVIIDHQYRGPRPFDVYLRVYLAPFIAEISGAVIQAMLLLIAGYVIGKTADRFLSPADKPRATSLRMATWLLIATPVVVFALIYGVGSVLPITDTRQWGGLLLTMMLTMVGIIGAFPLGVLLALGRRSDLPVIKYASTIYIEFVRGVPLITVLFMAQLLVPFLNPSLANVDNVFRAMVGITLFSAAYLAENVRGGLQSIPSGQLEAARALGLAGWQITLLILLPQALRAVIPALVGQFISLFKDTSLVAIVGLIDLTGISNAVVAQTEFIGLRREVYVFITLIYFVFSYVMSYISRRLEQSGSGAVRRS